MEIQYHRNAKIERNDDKMLARKNISARDYKEASHNTGKYFKDSETGDKNEAAFFFSLPFLNGSFVAQDEIQVLIRLNEENTAESWILE